MMDDGREQSNASSNGTNGVTQFLRHFSPRKADGLQGKTINRFRSLKAFPSNVSTVNDTISPNSVTASLNPATTLFLKKKSSRKMFKAEEEEIAFDGSNDGTRLGICPPCYDIPGLLLDGAVTPASDREVSFSNHLAARTTSASSTPNLFSSIAIWEESCPVELQINDPQLSPQKSVGSCESDDFNEENSFNTSASLPIHSPRNKKYCSSGSSVSSALMNKAKSIVFRSRDKDCNNSISSHTSRSRSSTMNSTKSVKDTDLALATNIKIFLLLVEPKSKVFELIQLFYPRKGTKVGDLLKMIPKNASEPTLASQSYVGVTRPKRRAEPTFNLNFLASNSVHNSTHPTAGIGHGEVIVAIPAHTTTREIVVLAKQILASSHIRKLIHLPKDHDITVKKTSSKKVKRRHDKDGSEESTEKLSYSSAATLTPCKITAVESLSPQDKKNLKNTQKTLKAVSFLDEICTDDLKRAINYANVANEEAGRSPCPSPGFSESDRVDTVISEDKAVEFPHGMLDAYLSKDDVMKICSTPTSSHIPNIEITSSCSMADDTGGTDTEDDTMSCEGSMSSSFHSWAQRLDSSISRLPKKCILLEQQKMTSSIEKLEKKKRNYMIKQLKRVAALVLFLSVLRYHLDPRGIQASHLQRMNVLFQPMRLLGFLHFCLSFVLFAKLQRYYLRSKMIQAPPKSRCPAIRWMTKLSKRVRNSSSSLHSVPRDPPPIPVPNDIHFA
jgi:hypothetical protein